MLLLYIAQKSDPKKGLVFFQGHHRRVTKRYVKWR